MTSLKNIISEYNSQVEKLTNEAKVALLKEIQTLFKTHPTLKSIGWNAYIPSWNDGDICSYTMDTSRDSLFINGINSYDEEWTREHAELARMVEPIISMLPEAMCEKIFGYNVTITVTEDGYSTEDYDCGY